MRISIPGWWVASVHRCALYYSTWKVKTAVIQAGHEPNRRDDACLHITVDSWKLYLYTAFANEPGTCALCWYFRHLVWLLSIAFARYLICMFSRIYHRYYSLTVVKILNGGFKCLCTTCCLGKSVVRQDYSQSSEFIFCLRLKTSDEIESFRVSCDILHHLL